MIKFCLYLSIIFLLMPLVVQGAFLDIIINEISWMGTESSVNNEWIELYNNVEKEVNIDDWTLKSEDGSPEITLEGKIPAKNYFLLERTDENSVPGVTADQIYTGALNNKGENLELRDNQNNLIDSVDCSEGWFAGDNSTKQTMERINPLIWEGQTSLNWQTSQNSGGTPKAENTKFGEDGPPQTDTSLVKDEPSLTKMDNPEDGSQTIKEEIKIEYPKGIVFNEILPSPKGPDSGEEWIEIFNQNNFEIALSDWKVRDTQGKTTIYAIPKDTIISAKSYLVFKRPETKITLNNAGDGLKLLNPNGDIVDSINFEKAITGESYNKSESGWFWSNNLTPGKANPVPIVPKTEKSEEKPLETEFPSETAAIGEKLPQLDSSLSAGNFSAIPIALIIALFSAAAILLLKKTM